MKQNIYTIFLFIILILVGCSSTSKAANEATASRTVLVVAPTLTSLSLESNVTTLNVGEKAELTVMGTYSDGTTVELEENVEYIITPSDNAGICLI